MENNRFIVKKMPKLANFQDFYNLKIEENEFIVDKEYLLNAKKKIDRILDNIQ